MSTRTLEQIAALIESARDERPSQQWQLARLDEALTALATHASQHAETVRLLEEVAAVIAGRTEGHTVVYSDRLRPLLTQIRAHLASLKPATRANPCATHREVEAHEQ